MVKCKIYQLFLLKNGLNLCFLSYMFFWLCLIEVNSEDDPQKCNGFMINTVILNLFYQGKCSFGLFSQIEKIHRYIWTADIYAYTV